METAEYRKHKNGFEFMKLKDGMVQSVLNTHDIAQITVSTSPLCIRDFYNNSVTLESSRKEFSTAMIKALEQINKMD